jgi:hypothetical protein
MGIFRGKRKKGLRLSIYRKPSTTYVSKNEKLTTTALHAFSSPSYSPDRKKSRWLSPPRHFESFHNVLLSTPKNVNDLERHNSFPLSTISPLPSSNREDNLSLAIMSPMLREDNLSLAIMSPVPEEDNLSLAIMSPVPGEDNLSLAIMSSMPREGNLSLAIMFPVPGRIILVWL